MVERIDLHELDTGFLEDLVTADFFERMVHHSSGSRITVAEGWTDQIVVSVEQHVVDAPGIDAEANDSVAVFVDRFADSDFDFFPE